MRPQPECPECEKLSRVSEEFNKIGDFLSWLSQKDVVLAEWEIDWLIPSSYRLSDSGITKMLADYFGIDLNKVEKERRALLEWVQEQYEENN